MNGAPPSTATAPFDALAAEAAACTACARMAGRSAVLGPSNGPVPARLLFVAEAPGRFGADRTRRPLEGDQSGRNFAALLHAAGIARSDVFVTNAVLCNPRDVAGRNAPPSASEIRNCGGFLARTIAVVDPAVVVALGAVALRALDALIPHGATLRDHVASPVAWSGRWLVPLYHPGARALIHRSLARQSEDYRGLAAFAASLGAGLPPGVRG